MAHGYKVTTMEQYRERNPSKIFAIQWTEEVFSSEEKTKEIQDYFSYDHFLKNVDSYWVTGELDSNGYILWWHKLKAGDWLLFSQPYSSNNPLFIRSMSDIEFKKKYEKLC